MFLLTIFLKLLRIQCDNTTHKYQNHKIGLTGEYLATRKFFRKHVAQFSTPLFGISDVRQIASHSFEMNHRTTLLLLNIFGCKSHRREASRTKLLKLAARVKTDKINSYSLFYISIFLDSSDVTFLFCCTGADLEGQGLLAVIPPFNVFLSDQMNMYLFGK